MSSSLVQTMKPLVPSFLRRFVRKAQERHIFFEAYREYLDLDPTLMPSEELLNRLVEGWGNQGFSAWSDYLHACLAALAESPGAVVECGSGLSTVLMGARAQRLGKEVVALEHHHKWFPRMQYRLRKLGITGARVAHAPLKSYDGFDWYDVRQTNLPGQIHVVICDGPPSKTRGGRVGMLPVLRDRLAPTCRILMDDAAREEEQAIMDLWARDFGLIQIPHEGDKPWAEMRFATS